MNKKSDKAAISIFDIKLTLGFALNIKKFINNTINKDNKPPLDSVKIRAAKSVVNIA